MPIAYASEVAKVANTSVVAVYDERGGLLFSRAGKLVSFTNATVSVRRRPNDPLVVTFDAKGRFLSTRLDGPVYGPVGEKRTYD